MTSTASITICAYSIPHLSHDQAERRDPAALSYFRIIHRRAFYIIGRKKRITLIFEGENKQIDSLYEALDEMSVPAAKKTVLKEFAISLLHRNL